MRWSECLRYGFVLGLLVGCGAASAWGIPGHRLIARLAEDDLSPPVVAEVRRLLALDGTRSLADAAVWADTAREQPGFRWSAPLHFVNLSRPHCAYRAELNCPGGNCVVAAIARFRAELGNRRSSDAQRAQALKFLLHLVGDVHQPLHAGFGEDAGGNRFQVSLHGRGSNLHAVWDSAVLEQRRLSETEHLHWLRALPAPAAGSAAPADWAEQACSLIESERVYPRGHRIGSAYLERQLPIAERQLRLAGVRLARALETALAP